MIRMTGLFFLQGNGVNFTLEEFYQDLRNTWADGEAADIGSTARKTLGENDFIVDADGNAVLFEDEVSGYKINKNDNCCCRDNESKGAILLLQPKLRVVDVNEQVTQQAVADKLAEERNKTETSKTEKAN